MTNYDDVVRQIQSAGLLPYFPLEVDGKPHRCPTTDSKERRGWYLLHIWPGKDLIVGSFGIWQGNNQNAIKVELSKDISMSDEERDALKTRLAEDKKRAAAQREHEAGRAARRAAAVWSKASMTMPAGIENDYLRRKGVQAYGLRYTESGALVIPMMNASGETKGLQFILPGSHPRVAVTHRDKEYWPKGLSKQGHWFQIGSFYAGAPVLIAEGYATAATLHAATGYPVAVAFDANNLLAVARAIKKTHRAEQILICADDDYLQRCPQCKKATPVATPTCQHCGCAHGLSNPGCAAASAAALAVGGAWLAPVFPGDREGKKLTDFNDLQNFPQGGLSLVRTQIDAKIAALGWNAAASKRGAGPVARGDGAAGDGRMVSRLNVDEAVRRYFGTYGMGGKILFDEAERRLIHKDDVMNLLPSHGWENMRSHPAWRVVRDHEIGFDPTERDEAIKCNLWGGWPVIDKDAKPVFKEGTGHIIRYDNITGSCDNQLDLLRYLCGNEENPDQLFEWLLKWLAYPLQHPGAKMQSAVVIHGPQGTGKSLFFEGYARIFGTYGRVLGQEALEDKFNSDWAEKKLCIIADEVLARGDMFHIKNRLKGFITGDTIRVNPKNLAAHNERNQMNIIFISNERMPLVLENDDRRHCVIWVPPKLSDEFFDAVCAEMDAGGIAALHDHLLRIDLRNFKPSTKPPMTSAKKDLIQQSASSEERFVNEWMALEIEGKNGEHLPFCPCLGSHVYKAYEHWCTASGERARRMQELIGFLGKKAGWRAGVPSSTWTNLRDPTVKSRKMVVPSDADMAGALERDKSLDQVQSNLMRERFESTGKWLTAGFFRMASALGIDAE